MLEILALIIEAGVCISTVFLLRMFFHSKSPEGKSFFSKRHTQFLINSTVLFSPGLRLLASRKLLLNLFPP